MIYEKFTSLPCFCSECLRFKRTTNTSTPRTHPLPREFEVLTVEDDEKQRDLRQQNFVRSFVCLFGCLFICVCGGDAGGWSVLGEPPSPQLQSVWISPRRSFHSFFTLAAYQSVTVSRLQRQLRGVDEQPPWENICGTVSTSSGVLKHSGCIGKTISFLYGKLLLIKIFLFNFWINK